MEKCHNMNVIEFVEWSFCELFQFVDLMPEFQHHQIHVSNLLHCVLSTHKIIIQRSYHSHIRINVNE